MAWLQLLGGGLLLYFGAEWFVGGASALALSLRVPQLVVGLTVVAYGTSAPEVIVGIQAALADRGAVALGNVIGSNIANIGLILGAAALLRPSKVDRSLRRRELPVLVGTTALVPVILLDGAVTRSEAGVLMLLAVAYTTLTVRSARGARATTEARADTAITAAAADAAGAPATRSTAGASMTALFGLGVLLVGGHLFIEGAVDVARALGMSDRLVGLTIVAVGTSLPELVTSLIAASRGHSDIAVGNVVGSNIFNVLLCLGAAATAAPLRAPLAAAWPDLVALAAMTILAATFIRTERYVSRLEGAIALGLYALFVALTVARG